MKAVVLEENQKLRLIDRPKPQPKAGECLIRIRAAGVCSSDIYRGFENGAYHYPLVMGHELAGEIVEVGADWNHSKAQVGSSVVVFPLLPCKTCDQCLQKEYARCRKYDYFGSRRDGGFSEYLTVPAWNVLPLPEGLKFHQASLVEPISVVVHALKKTLPEKPPQKICILGAGFLGLVATELLVSKYAPSAEVTLIDRNDYKLEKITNAKVNKVLLRDPKEKEEFLKSHLATFDFVLEAVGVPETFQNSIDLCAPGGTVVWMGNISGNLELSQKQVSSILRKELTLRGTWNSSYDPEQKSDWSETLELLAKDIDVEPFITQKIEMADLPSVIEKLHQHKTRKQEFTSIKVVMTSEDASDKD
ncbi:MAG: hypothetical protein CL676_01495 [Bdellovibrionaceae bacterium]|nr:hypothetical protein [Pseudobdellovibrionaceae bacterium]|tara:strand:+ start:1155 stop:2237 length:1083 start_codon:yes stop_codon:yes gene_type:complete